MKSRIAPPDVAAPDARKCAASRRVCDTGGAAVLALAGVAAQAGTAAPETLRARNAPPRTVWVEEIGLEKFSQRRGTPRAGRTLRDQHEAMVPRHGAVLVKIGNSSMK